MGEEVKQLVKNVYETARCSFEELSDSFDISNCKRDSVLEAIGYLKQLRKLFVSRKSINNSEGPDVENIEKEKLWLKFRKCVPFVESSDETLKDIVRKMELCQVGQ